MELIKNIINENIVKAQTEGGHEVYRFKVSDEKINRNGWKIQTYGIDYSAFLKNPIILKNHNSWSDPIGKAENIFAMGDSLYADIWFHEETEDSRLTKKLVDLGILSTCSICIRVKKKGNPLPIPFEEKDAYPSWIHQIEVYEKSELYEISIVIIPANEDAVFEEKLSAAFDNGQINIQEMNMIKAEIQLAAQQQFISEMKNELREIKMTKSNVENILSKIENYLINNKEAQMPDTIVDTSNEVIEKLNNSINEYVSKLETASAEIQTLKNEIEKANENKLNLEKSLTEIKIKNLELQTRMIEIEVEAKLIELKDKILPAENNAENQYKLKRDLIHLKTNSETLKDADGVSLYEIKINEIASKPSIITTLNDPLNLAGTSDKPNADFDIKSLDIMTNEARALIVKEAEKRASQNNTSFDIEYQKIKGELK
jgi:phage head maturation protease